MATTPSGRRVFPNSSSNATQTEAVLFGEHGAIAQMKPGHVVIASATVSPDFAISLGKRIEAAGLQMLDAPVSGGAIEALIAGYELDGAAFGNRRVVNLPGISVSVNDMVEASGIPNSACRILVSAQCDAR